MRINYMLIDVTEGIVNGRRRTGLVSYRVVDSEKKIEAMRHLTGWQETGEQVSAVAAVGRHALGNVSTTTVK